MGIVSAIGNSLDENRDSLFTTKSGIGPITQLDSIYANRLPVGEVKLRNSDLIEILKLPKINNYTRTSLLGVIAAKEAVRNSGISSKELADAALISATTVGGMDMTEKYIKQFGKGSEFNRYLESHKAADGTQKIAEKLGIKKFTTTISTACSSAANAMILGSKLIESGKYKTVIVGGTDALCMFTLNGFNSLKILSDEICAPFDDNRKGLNLGEGAAYLILEAVNDEITRPILAYLTGYGNANDAYHQTASSENGEGAFKAMTLALNKAELNPDAIDYVNAHGTATQNNDLSESVAIRRIFGENVPVFSSTKSLTGHTLAAAGAVEAVFSILSLQQQTVPANFNFREPIAETALVPLQKARSMNIEHVLSNSFGFGGNCSSLLFSKA